MTRRPPRHLACARRPSATADSPGRLPRRPRHPPPGDVVALLGPERLGQVDPRQGHPRSRRAPRRGHRAVRRAAGPVPRLHPARLRPPATLPLGLGPGHGRRDRRGRPAPAPAVVAARRPARTGASSCASLEVVGLGDRAGEDVSTFSGGQQRRVLIARALAAPARRPRHGRAHGRRRRRQPARPRRRPPPAGRRRARRWSSSPTSSRPSRTSSPGSSASSGGAVDFDGTAAAYAAHCGVHGPGDDHHPHLAPTDPDRATTIGVAGPLDPPDAEEAVAGA